MSVLAHNYSWAFESHILRASGGVRRSASSYSFMKSTEIRRGRTRDLVEWDMPAASLLREAYSHLLDLEEYFSILEIDIDDYTIT